jgi:tetratricopeptide (TPR) repeat protein
MATEQTDGFIQVAGRRLNPQASPEWQLLLTHLEISEGFSFVILLVPDADWAHACRLALSYSLEPQRKGLLTVDFANREDFQSRLPGRLLDLHVSERTGAVWLEKTVSELNPQFAEWRDAWRGMVARLNQVRNPLRRHFKVPLIFVGANWIQPLIRENAPDLWSVRTLVTRVEPVEVPESVLSKTEEATEQELEGLAIDPDLALKTAARLVGQTGHELVRAELLYRAGRGLIARSQWTEAERALREAMDLQRRFHAPEETLADTLRWLAESLDSQYRLDEATAMVEEAQGLYVRAGNVLGEANCIRKLGVIALEQSDHATAQARFEKALSLYRRVDFILGEAISLQLLGLIALRRSDSRAQDRFEEALSLCQKVSDVVGEANCIYSLGEIALERSDHATAQARFEEALLLYRRVGSVLGEANSVRALGQIALRHSDYARAQARFEEALPLYRSIGDVLGEANCIQGLGDIARQQGLRHKAQQQYREALQLFEQISEPYSIGWTHKRLAQLDEDLASRQAHLEAAREAWSQIDRIDLIESMEAELKTTEGINATNG